MPVMDGIDAAIEMRKHPLVGSMRIVMATAVSESGCRMRFTDYDCFLPTPCLCRGCWHCSPNLDVQRPLRPTPELTRAKARRFPASEGQTCIPCMSRLELRASVLRSSLD